MIRNLEEKYFLWAKAIDHVYRGLMSWTRFLEVHDLCLVFFS